MTILFVLLTIVLVVAVAAIAVWLWLFIGIVDQVAALIRIKIEEQVAVWRIESIGRIAQLEQQHVREAHSRRSKRDG